VVYSVPFYLNDGRGTFDSQGELTAPFHLPFGAPVEGDRITLIPAVGTQPTFPVKLPTGTADPVANTIVGVAEPGARIGGVKIFSDGATCGKPAISVEYPPERGGGYGDLWLSETELSRVIAEAHNAGYQVAIHAWGDRAAATVLGAYASVLNGQPNTLRHRIEHNTLVQPQSRPHYGQIGLIPSFMGFSPTCRILRGEGWPAIYGPERESWIYNYRAILDENPGLHATWHGDDPFLGPVSPIVELYDLVTRKEIADDGAICEPPDWLAATAPTVEEALPLMTIDGAYALFREEDMGSLKPGKLDDLIILSDDPLAVDPDDLKDTEVLMTMIGG
jgi:predicted amidohydrolase YtcJ